jgi:hypothetical protein
MSYTPTQRVALCNPPDGGYIQQEHVCVLLAGATDPVEALRIVKRDPNTLAPLVIRLEDMATGAQLIGATVVECPCADATAAPVAPFLDGNGVALAAAVFCSNFNATAAPDAGSSPVHPDRYIGQNNAAYLGTPLGWVRVACVNSPTGYIALPAYVVA